MATIREDGAVLSATFRCAVVDLKPSDATLSISAVSYSSSTNRELATKFWSIFHEDSGLVSVFTNQGEIREEGPFATHMFPASASRRSRCSRFDQGAGNSLLRVLHHSAAEVAFFNRDLAQPLLVKGKYVRSDSRQSTTGGGGDPLVKLVIGDSRLKLLDSKRGEYIHKSHGIRFTRLDKYESTDIAAGTIIVLVNLRDPFPVGGERTLNLQAGQFRVPRGLESNIWRVHDDLNNCGDYIVRLVRYIDLCTNPIIDGPADSEEYLNDLWNQEMRMTMRQLLVGAEFFDPAVLDRILEILGTRISECLDKTLTTIGRRLEFRRVQELQLL
ncbi:unnamed protein product [Microthlaspi erraticum]|uniref:Uncharacterized protein n=1 Tax=Microthlaspi erraticum TaxID=1685480 RepID=A0A6D2JRA9_9BRAS|nr:unnamed protein product [Microthlaspi erraticum]